MEKTDSVVLNEQQSNNNQTKKKSTLRIIGDVVFWVIVGLFASIMICRGLDKATKYSLPVFGLRDSVVVSESMSVANPENDYLTSEMKRIKKNDVIITRIYHSYNEIQLYDVITYYSSNGLICHRVVDKYEDNGQKYLVTRGDSNNADDEPINYSLVRGKVINVIHGVGGFVTFLQSPYFLIGFSSSLFFVFLGMLIYDYEHDKRTMMKTEDYAKIVEAEQKKEK